MGIVSDLTCGGSESFRRFNSQVIDGLEQIEDEQDSMLASIYKDVNRRMMLVENVLSKVWDKMFMNIAMPITSVESTVQLLESEVDNYLQLQGQAQSSGLLTPQTTQGSYQPQEQSQQTIVPQQVQPGTLQSQGQLIDVQQPQTIVPSVDTISRVPFNQGLLTSVPSSGDLSPQIPLDSVSVLPTVQSGREETGDLAYAGIPVSPVDSVVVDQEVGVVSNTQERISVQPEEGQDIYQRVQEIQDQPQVSSQPAEGRTIEDCCSELVNTFRALALTIERQNQVISLLQGLVKDQKVQPIIGEQAITKDGKIQELVPCDEVRPDPIPNTYCDINNLNDLVDVQNRSRKTGLIDKRMVSMDLLFSGNVHEIQPDIQRE